MNILMFGWEFPPFISGGLGTACFEITRALTALGNSISFVLPLYDGASPSLLSPSFKFTASRTGSRPAASAVHEDKLTLLHLPALLFPYQRADGYDASIDQENVQAPFRKNIYAGDLVSEVHRYGRNAAGLAESLSFDIIHSHDWMTIPAAGIARKRSCKPWILHVHSLEYDRSGEHANREIVDIEKNGLDAADRIIAVSARTKEMIVKHYGIHPDKVTVIYNAVSIAERTSVSQPCRDERRRTVLFLGRITFQKGPDYFLEAAAIVLKHLPDVLFVMAGTGDMMEQLVRRTGELGIGSHFHFTGFLQGEELERIFSSSDLYVMPSVSEPFGISPLEAMAYDVPVIISRQSGVSEILKNALKVDFWDIPELASLMISVLQRPALAQTMVREARRELKNFQWKESADKIVEVYTRALKDSQLL